MLAKIQIIDRNILSSARKTTSSITFIFIMTKQHYQLKWLLDEIRGAETCQKGNKITKSRQRKSKEKHKEEKCRRRSLLFPPTTTKGKLQNETERPSGLDLEQCSAEALKSMTTTLPWMPTITQMVYLENYTGHLTKSRHSTDRA